MTHLQNIYERPCDFSMLNYGASRYHQFDCIVNAIMQICTVGKSDKAPCREQESDWFAEIQSPRIRTSDLSPMGSYRAMDLSLSAPRTPSSDPTFGVDQLQSVMST